MGLSKLTLCLFIAQILSLAFVYATPLNNPDELAGIFARRLRPAGTQCSEDSQCISNRCVTDGFYPNGTLIPFTCHRQQPGGHCTGNNNCQTFSCNKTSDTCNYASLGGRCFEYTDCFGWLDSSQACSSGRCKYVQGKSGCKKNSSCVTNFCSKGVCRALPQAPNAPCSINSECLSNSCEDVPYDKCTNPDGTFADRCPGLLQNCGRYPNGHTCANNGECKNGLCQSGVCRAGQDGAACVEQYQCSGICGSNGQCFTPTNGSLYPNDVCQTNSQCNSGRCTTSQQQKDNYGVNNVILDNRYPPRCDYLNNGQQGCRSFTDCKTGLCQSGTCKLGKDGDRCQVNYNCKHLCGLDGICYTPSGPQPRRSPCKTGTDCLSGNCKFGYSSVNRPNLQSNDPDFFIGVDDTSCAASPLAGACSVDSDCGQGVCSSDNICTLLPIGSSCTDKSQCVTHECYFEPGNYDAGGTCQLASPYTACKRDDQCLSNSCVAQYCRTRDTNPYGYTYYGSCAPVACAASTLNEACRQDSDCGYNGSLGCGANKTCKKTDGQTCSASSECLNGACSNGSCVDPATLKTTTSSTSKTTTKKTTTSKATKTTTSKTTTTTTKSTKSSTTKSKTSTASSSAPSKA